MCTVILRVPESSADPVRMLAIRDEDPARPWQPLGAWWPDRPGVVGVRDVRAGGAWLAAASDTRRLAVLLNRESPPIPDGVVPVSRGMIVLDAVTGRDVHPTAAVRGFNLVEITPDSVRVTMWDGVDLRRVAVGPGTHMIAHDDLDDVRTARITAWRDAFAADDDTTTDAAGLPAGWLDVLARSADRDATDPQAIIRDNRPLGYPTQSLLLCTAVIGRDVADVRGAAFDEPGRWNAVTPVGPV